MKLYRLSTQIFLIIICQFLMNLIIIPVLVILDYSSILVVLLLVINFIILTMLLFMSKDKLLVTEKGLTEVVFGGKNRTVEWESIHSLSIKPHHFCISVVINLNNGDKPIYLNGGLKRAELMLTKCENINTKSRIFETLQLTKNNR